MAVLVGQTLVQMSAFDFVISSCSAVHRWVEMVAVSAEAVFAFVACDVVVVGGPCYY